MSNVHKLPVGLDQQGRHDTRRARWCEQDWRDTMQQVERRAPYQYAPPSRSGEVRKLLVWACVSWALFCVVLAVAAVLVS